MSESQCFIQKLPLEILLRITDQLNTVDLGSMRLTCRQIMEAHEHTFIDQFFTRKQFMISRFSLQALIDIAKSRLGKHLRYVHISIETLRVMPQVANAEAYLRYQAEHALLWRTGTHMEMLIEAFRNLPALEGVRIRGFNSRRRTRDARDGIRREWNSYGFTTANEEVGGPVPPFDYDATQRRMTSQVFPCVLFALGKAEARPKSIEIWVRSESALFDVDFALSPFTEEVVDPVIRNLEKLHIHMQRDPSFETTWGHRGHGRINDLLNFKFLMEFLCRATALRDLRINYESGMNDLGTLLLNWMMRPLTKEQRDEQGLVLGKDTSDEPWPSFLDQLESLSIGYMMARANDLLSLFETVSPTLKNFELWRVTLTDDTSPDLAPPDNETLWPAFFREIREFECPNLRHIKAGNLSQEMLGQGRLTVKRMVFPGNETEIEYTGPDWKHFAGEVERKISVHNHWGTDYISEMESFYSDDDGLIDDDGLDLDVDLNDVHQLAMLLDPDYSEEDPDE